ncbi:phosphopantetheine-binding protein, partial [Micromonospora sp. DT229]|uniref:phosphopantetheine-binding protein n=1 Tax=Micromonospora sp. DT229 TaxID=3393430 RepID=UPI003CF07BE9
YHGRTDHQTKIRGTRIELTETHQHLVLEPSVQAAHVVVHPDRDGQPQLVAYLQPAADAPAEPGELVELVRSGLRRRLPEAMVPSRFVVLHDWPVTANGKLDTRALPDPSTVDARTQVARDFVEPRTPTEQALAGVWRTLLEVQRIGAEDDFFDLGGHSLLATRLAARLRAEFRVDVALADLFAAPTLAEMAVLVEQAQRTAAAPLAPIRRADRTRYTISSEGNSSGE